MKTYNVALRLYPPGQDVINIEDVEADNPAHAISEALATVSEHISDFIKGDAIELHPEE